MISDDKKKIALVAPLTSFTGYGQYGRSLAQVLVHLYGKSQQIELLFYDFTKYQYEKFDLTTSRYRTLIPFLRQNQTEIKQIFIDILITVSTPHAFLTGGLINIGVTALAEASSISPEMVQHCNRVDEVLVMSQFNVDTLKASVYSNNATGGKLNLLANVDIAPYAMKEIEYNGQKTQITEFLDKIPQKFLFMNVGEWLPGSIGADRKDIGALIATFLQGFANNKDIGLLLKAEQGNPTILSEYRMRQKMFEIYDVMRIEMEIPNVYFISGNLHQSQMVEMYQHQKVKAFTTFTHGQSCGIPIMEFAYYTGKPLIIPFHSGIRDYVAPEYLEVLIDKQVDVPQQLYGTYIANFIGPNSKWRTVDYQYALFKMADVINGYEMFSQKSLKQKSQVASNYNIEVVSEKIKKIIDKHLVQDDLQD